MLKGYDKTFQSGCHVSTKVHKHKPSLPSGMNQLVGGHYGVDFCLTALISSHWKMIIILFYWNNSINNFFSWNFISPHCQSSHSCPLIKVPTGIRKYDITMMTELNINLVHH